MRLSFGTSLFEAFIVSYLVNLCHTFYGISLLKDYEGIEFRLLNIALLTDEVFAIFKSVKILNADEQSRFFLVLNVVSWFYWVTGTVIGCI
ncbi:MAG: AzlC family ABC transporter permease [Campylobacter sp.]